MEIGKYGDREVAITYLDSIEHRSLGATVQELKKEREEDKAARRAQETKIEAQAIAIEQLQEQVAQLLLASASAPSPLAARAEADDRREATQIAERVPRVLHPSDEESQTASEETGAGNEAKPPLPVQSTDSLNMGS